MAVVMRRAIADAPAMRNIGGVLFGAFVGFWLGRALFVWILDLSRGVEIAAMIACAVVGALVVLSAELSERRTSVD